MAVATVRSALGLEGRPYPCKFRSETKEHILDHVVGANAENIVLDFRRQMPISQVPSKAHQLMGVLVPDFDNQFRRGLDFQPPPIFELQAIAIGHRHRFRKIEKDVFALISSQANTAAMTRIKVERKSPRGPFLRPMPGGAMNGRAMHGHLST
jgi:hypothetical protein